MELGIKDRKTIAYINNKNGFGLDFLYPITQETMHKLSTYFKPIPATVLVILNFLNQMLFYLLISFFSVSNFGVANVIHSLIIGLFWTYIWITFRQVIVDHYKTYQADLFIIIFILGSLSSLVFTGEVLGEFIPEFVKIIYSVGIASAYVIFAIRMLAGDISLFGLQKHFGWSVILLQAYSIGVWQILYTVMPSIVSHSWSLRFGYISVALFFYHSLILVMIFLRAHKTPVPKEPDPHESLIEDIGAEIEEI